MLKGLYATLTFACLAMVPQIAPAQVYRCEGPGGVTYSDMPCGAGAEQIEVAGDVLDSKGVGGSEAPAAAAQAMPQGEGVQATESGGQDLNSFLEMLRSQRTEQIAQIDSQLALLRERASSADFLDMEVAEQDSLNSQIAQLESDRVSILAEYEALISEAESRLQ